MGALRVRVLQCLPLRWTPHELVLELVFFRARVTTMDRGDPSFFYLQSFKGHYNK